MSGEYVVMILVAGITAVGGWIGNHISNKPKRDDSQMNRINLIITQYESWNDDLKERNIKLKKENHVLREKITCLEKRIKELEGGE
ncbi:hypothetical protein [Jeotgalicoccus sp. WY2]|uniref:hypothetical protein n=1 Tax=Jeotgalicoccus sp. WY2 TaxID=2708346 RepID=UPI001BD542D8|nr:hypothetical protein [Jeotgalicoccus sp. WY2]